MAADRHEPGTRAPDVAAGEREVHDRARRCRCPCSCCVIPIDQTSTADFAAAYMRAKRSMSARVAPEMPLEVRERLTLELLEQLVEPDGVVADERRGRSPPSASSTFSTPLTNASVATGVHGEELVGHLRAEHRALDVARHPVALETGLAQRVDDHDLRPALAGEVQVLHEHRLGVRDVGAEQHDQVAVDHVGVRAGRRAPPRSCASARWSTAHGTPAPRCRCCCVPRNRVTFCAT